MTDITAFQRRRRELAAQKEQEQPKALDQMTVAELKVIAKEKGIKGCDNMRKTELLSLLEQQDKEPVKGGGDPNDGTAEVKDKTGDILD